MFNKLSFISTWFNRNKTEFIEHLSAFFIPFLIILTLNLKYLNFYKDSVLDKKNNHIVTITIFLFTLIGLSFWFLRSPVIRFGIPYLYVFSFFFIIFMFRYIFRINFIFKRGILIVLFLSLVFNTSKNFNRILNFENRVGFWPKILYVEFSTKKLDSYSINFPNSKIVSNQHQYCWSIPFICHISGGKGINIYSRKSYIFIQDNRQN